MLMCAGTAAWPRRLRAPQPGLPVTSGALHAGGAWAVIGGSIRRPETQLWLSTSNFACNSPETLSNRELTTLELQRFQILLKLLPIELHARFGWRWCRRLPRVPQSGPVGQASRWFETLVAFACLCLCGVEAAIAFAGEKWAFLVQFVGAEVMAVSVVPCWGCAVVLLVSTSPCFCVLCAIFVALLGLMWVRAQKSSPCVLTMAKNWRLMARWASIFADQQSWDPAGRVCCAE